MSIASMCDRDTIEIRRLTSSDDSEGVPTKVWTTGARGSLPALAVKCRIQRAAPEEIIAYGLKGERDPVRLYFSSDPHLSPEDVVVINSIIYRVISPSFDWDNQSRIWRCMAQKFSNAD